ncbi:MAG: hypothetical protein GX905_10770 [Bacteroidales bacterium]|nr:hypothetical protein [Bacteroidales bacterium]
MYIQCFIYYAFFQQSTHELFWGIKSFVPQENVNPELFQYYYHADHLGSTSLIANLNGEVVQHIEYVPFGEVFIEEHNNKWNTPYLFNAKELDEETGLYYYGARYYDPRVSIWLSTDPLQEKYPNISSYAYTAYNPVKYIDPNGEDIVIAEKNNSSITIATDLIDVNINAGSLLGDFGGNYNLAGTDILIATLDIVGIFDPTGIADIAAASLEASEGNWGSAFLSGLGVIPYVGDLGKTAKIGKHAKTINKAIESAKTAENLKTANKVVDVKLRKNVVEKILKNAPKTKDGRYIDPNTRKPIDGPFDMGHKTGQKWKNRKKMHQERGSTRKEVIEMENNLNLYQIESRSLNRSHKYEKKD